MIKAVRTTNLLRPIRLLHNSTTDHFMSENVKAFQMQYRRGEKRKMNRKSSRVSLVCVPSTVLQINQSWTKRLKFDVLTLFFYLFLCVYAKKRFLTLPTWVKMAVYSWESGQLKKNNLCLLCFHPLYKIVQKQWPSKVWIIITEVREAYLSKNWKKRLFQVQITINIDCWSATRSDTWQWCKNKCRVASSKRHKLDK